MSTVIDAPLHATDLTKYIEFARVVVKAEAQTIETLIDRLDLSFAHACEILMNCKGRIAVIGMGKSGHIGAKIAATLSSTGSPALFVHPGEASHGDLGMITRQDVALVISNSGETGEILSILPVIEHLKIPMISMTGQPDSTLAKQALYNINIGVKQEACPLGLAPTSSTTATLVMGDAIALTLLQYKGFTQQDFALYHPSGNLGKRLLLKISKMMRTGDAIPKIQDTSVVKDALVEMTQKNLGMTSVINEHGVLIGIYTDGDVRRTLSMEVDIKVTQIREVMTRDPKTIPQEMLAADALLMMENHKITSLLVVNENGSLVGVAHMHDLLNAGLKG